MLPKVEYKEYIWEPGYLLDDYDIWQRIEMEKPYRAALPALIADAEISVGKEASEIYAAAVEAIARFDAGLAQKSIAMPQILLRSESASSSQIEHLSASAKNVALAELGGTKKNNAALVAGNIKAMQKALEQTAPISKETLLLIHSALLEDADPKIAGKFRTKQVWIGGRGGGPHSAAFVPPHCDDMEKYLDDWVAFANRTDIHALLKAAVAHCQFETIHPFLDGNGRTGRALIQIMLHEAGLIRKSALPLSAGLLADVREYFSALTAYRDGDYEPITVLFSNAALDAAEIGTQTVNRFEELKEDWNSKIKARKDAAVWRLIDILLAQPVVDAKFVTKALGVADPVARNAISQLCEAEILKRVSDRSRNVFYEAHEAAALADRFASEIGRRSA